MNKFEDLLKEVLIVSKFDGDEDKFVSQFMVIAREKAVVKMIESLPNEKKALITKQAESILQNVDKKLYSECLEVTAIELFKNYLKVIENYLAQEQKDRISDLISFYKSEG